MPSSTCPSAHSLLASPSTIPYVPPMPPQLHEELLSLVRESEGLVRTIAAWATGRSIPDDLRLRLHEQVYSQMESLDCRPDLVFEFVRDGASAPTALMVFEVQLAPDPEKRLTWPVFQGVLWSVHRCPTTVVVLAPDPEVAAWCAEPIDLDGTGRSIMQPIVIGPERIPVVVDPREAERVPGLSVLSDIVHRRSRR